MRHIVRSSLCFSLLLAACSDDAPGDADTGVALDTSVDVTADTDQDAGDDANADVTAAVPPAPTGTSLIFDLEVATGTATADDWYDFPFPSDLRLDADGTAPMSALPNLRNQPLVAGLIETADDLPAYSQVPVAWFRFSAPLAVFELETELETSVDAGAYLINIDEESSTYLELAPIVAKTLVDDNYTASNVLAVGVYPGWVLEPDTTYAFVVSRDWNDASAAALGVPEALWNMAHGESSGDADVDANYAPLWTALEGAQVDPATVAAATVFTTGDPVADVFAMTEAIREQYDLTLDNLQVDPDDGADHPRFCEIIGTMDVPEFQEGTPPFNTGGLFVFGEDGLPIEQNTSTIPVVLNLPLEEMPAEGYPLVMYFHGSGGTYNQVVDRGPTDAPGEGPAHVLAAHGMATVGSAHPVNPDRLEAIGVNASGFDYLNLQNLKSFRDNFRQGVIEQRLFLDALLSVEISAEVVASCDGLSLPEGQDAYRFNPDAVMAMGQSMGGMFTNIMAPVEPRIGAVVPTGAGGMWSYFILETSLIPGVGGLVSRLLGVADLTHLHPSLHMMQMAWEPVEPLVFVPRLAHDPLPGHPVRPIYEPVGDDDSYFPPVVFDRIALAYRNQQAGDVVWDTMQDSLAQRGLDGLAEYPVVGNRTSVSGEAYTGVVVQYPDDGVIENTHNIFQYYDEVKYQYGCFFETFYRTGVATVPAPDTLGVACPGL